MFGMRDRYCIETSYAKVWLPITLYPDKIYAEI